MGQTALRELAVKNLSIKTYIGTSIGKQVMEGIFPTPHSDYGDLSQNPTSHFQVLWRILAHLGPSRPILALQFICSIVEIVAFIFDSLGASSIVWGKNVRLCKVAISRKCL